MSFLKQEILYTFPRNNFSSHIVVLNYSPGSWYRQTWIQAWNCLYARFNFSGRTWTFILISSNNTFWSWSSVSGGKRSIIFYGRTDRQTPDNKWSQKVELELSVSVSSKLRKSHLSLQLKWTENYLYHGWMMRTLCKNHLLKKLIFFISSKLFTYFLLWNVIYALSVSCV